MVRRLDANPSRVCGKTGTGFTEHKNKSFSALTQELPWFGSKHRGGAMYEKFILLFFMQYILNGSTEREVLILELLRWFFS